MSENILDRVKLLMRYDSKKTLSENIEENNLQLKEQLAGVGYNPNQQYATSAPEPPSEIKDIISKFKDAFCGIGIAENDLKDAFRLIKTKVIFDKIQDYLSKSPLCYNRKWNSLSAIYNESYTNVLDNNKKKIAKKVTDHLKTIVSFTGGAVETDVKDARTGQPSGIKTIDVKTPIEFNTQTTPTPGSITPRQQHINNIWCSVKNGIITAGGGWNGDKWEDYVKGVSPNVTVTEIETAKKSCSKENKKEIKTPVQPPADLNVKLFQSWLDQAHPGWHKKYSVLGNDPNKGYGKYGPNTQKAWASYKDEYLQWIAAGGNFDVLNQKETTLAKDNGIEGGRDITPKIELGQDVKAQTINTPIANPVSDEVKQNLTRKQKRQLNIPQ